jgi:GNAT superfamily N-acetyltransferase
MPAPVVPSPDADVGPDQAAAAVTATQTHIDRIMDDGWVESVTGAFAWATGVALANFNGVLVETAEAVTGGVVATLLERVAGGAGRPHCLQARPAARAEAEALARARGMSPTGTIPLMVRDRAADLARPDGPDLAIRPAGRPDAARFVAVAAAGFEAPEALFRELLVDAGFELPGARAYLGYRDGRPVATAMGLTLSDSVGVFNVSTVPGHRGRGIGAAMTARAVADGVAAGATWAWLQSTPAGHPVYERLGFRDIEHWVCWVADP